VQGWRADFGACQVGRQSRTQPRRLPDKLRNALVRQPQLASASSSLGFIIIHKIKTKNPRAKTSRKYTNPKILQKNPNFSFIYKLTFNSGSRESYPKTPLLVMGVSQFPKANKFLLDEQYNKSQNNFNIPHLVLY
jgi:hypothetical protein